MRVYQANDFMTTQPPNPPKLTPQAQQLLDWLREVGDWTNRTELAKRAGKSMLNK
jgi:hypothetical protein